MKFSTKAYEYVNEVLESQLRKSADSRMTEKWEVKFAEAFGVKYAISHVNGTVTMHSALAALGVGPGDEVIVPALTMAAPALVVLYCGATPVFADVDQRTFVMDAEDAGRKITERTKAIIPVSLYGLAPDFDAILKVADGIPMIEDDAECFLGYYKGRVVGSIGLAASFSFESTKHLTCGEGGMLITNDEEFATKAREFGNLGYPTAVAEAGGSRVARSRIQDPKYARHLTLGWNYRISELCAAVGLAQVEAMEELVKQRQRIASLYEEARNGCEWLTPQFTPEDCVNSYWTYVVALNTEIIDWYEFRDKFVEYGGDGPYAAWRTVYLEPVFRDRGYERGLCPNAEYLQSRLVQFPTNHVEPGETERNVEALSKTISYFGG